MICLLNSLVESPKLGIWLVLAQAGWMMAVFLAMVIWIKIVQRRYRRRCPPA